MVWKNRQPARLDLWKPRRALPPLLIAFGHAIYNALRSPSQKQSSYNEMWVAILIIVVVYGVLSAAHYAYQTLWNPVVVSPADLARTKNAEYEVQSEKSKSLEARINALETTEKADQQKVKLSASLKTEARSKPILMRMSTQISSYPLIVINVSEMTLVIYNQGERPVRLRKYKLWKLGAVEASQENNLDDIVDPSVPANVDVTEPLLHVISGQAQHDLDSVLGTCRIRVVVTYSEDLKQADSQPQDFQITSQRIGGAAIKIIADEITT